MVDLRASQVQAPAPIAWLLGILPGLFLSALIAVAAVLSAPALARVFPIPAMVIALLIGIALHPLAQLPQFAHGIAFCLRTILRCAVALLGLRIALGDIIALGVTGALLVIVAMAATVISGFLFARAFGQSAAY